MPEKKKKVKFVNGTKRSQSTKRLTMASSTTNDFFNMRVIRSKHLKQFYPELFNRTYFKAATSFHDNLPDSLGN